MEGRIYSPEKGKFVSLKTKHGQKVLKNYNEHRVGGDKHQNCAYCKIVNPQTGKLVSTYGQTGGRVIRDCVKQEGGVFDEKYMKILYDNNQHYLEKLEKHAFKKTWGKKSRYGPIIPIGILSLGTYVYNPTNDTCWREKKMKNVFSGNPNSMYKIDCNESIFEYERVQYSLKNFYQNVIKAPTAPTAPTAQSNTVQTREARKEAKAAEAQAARNAEEAEANAEGNKTNLIGKYFNLNIVIHTEEMASLYNKNTNIKKLLYDFCSKVPNSNSLTRSDYFISIDKNIDTIIGTNIDEDIKYVFKLPWYTYTFTQKVNIPDMNNYIRAFLTKYYEMYGNIKNNKELNNMINNKLKRLNIQVIT
jgi:hypothetical protein